MKLRHNGVSHAASQSDILNRKRFSVRFGFAVTVAALVLLTVGCSNELTEPVAAKISAPSAHAELRPLPDKKFAPVSSTEGIGPKCANGQQTVYINANKTREFVDVDNTGVVVRTTGATAPHPASSATYEFTRAQPKVRAVYVTVMTNRNHLNDVNTGLVIPPVTHHFQANWPLQASMLPTAVSVNANDFLVGSSLVGVMFCRR